MLGLPARSKCPGFRSRDRERGEGPVPHSNVLPVDGSSRVPVYLEPLADRDAQTFGESTGLA
jgi:hypothetical protein